MPNSCEAGTSSSWEEILDVRRSQCRAIEGVLVVCIHEEEGCVEEAVQCHDNRRNGARHHGGTGADEEPYKGVTRKSNDCSSTV